jgi:hypothetical protein
MRPIRATLLLLLLSTPALAAHALVASATTTGSSVRDLLETRAPLVKTANGGFIRRTFDADGTLIAYERDRSGSGKIDETMHRVSANELVIERDTTHKGRFDERVTRIFDRGKILSEVTERPRARIERTYIHERNMLIEVRLYDDQGSGQFSRIETERFPLRIEGGKGYTQAPWHSPNSLSR